MRSFFRFLLAAVFVVGFPVVLLLAIPKLNGFTITKYENELQKSGVYTQISQTVQEQLTQSAASGGAGPADLLGGLVKDELTPEYIQGKVEDVLNQTAAWSTGQTKTPPSISFNDLQQKVLAKSPLTRQQMDDALAQLKTAEQANGGQLPQLSSDPQQQAALQQALSQTGQLDKIANGDWTISLEGPLAGLPLAMRVYTFGLPIISLLIVLALAGAVALGVGLLGKLKSAGWILIAAGIWNGILAAAFVAIFFGQGLFRFIPASAGIGREIAAALFSSLQTSLFDGYVGIETGVTLVLIIAGAALLATGISKKRKTVATTPAALNSKPQSQNSTAQTKIPASTNESLV